MNAFIVITQRHTVPAQLRIYIISHQRFSNRGTQTKGVRDGWGNLKIFINICNIKSLLHMSLLKSSGLRFQWESTSKSSSDDGLYNCAGSRPIGQNRSRASEIQNDNKFTKPQLIFLLAICSPRRKRKWIKFSGVFKMNVLNHTPKTIIIIINTSKFSYLY